MSEELSQEATQVSVSSLSKDPDLLKKAGEYLKILGWDKIQERILQKIESLRRASNSIGLPLSVSSREVIKIAEEIR